MGLYQNNLKRTLIGYQFDHPVYVGNQINDNRLVTYKEIGQSVAAMVSSAEHVQYTLSSSVTATNGIAATIQLKANGAVVADSTVKFSLSFTYDSADSALVISYSNT